MKSIIYSLGMVKTVYMFLSCRMGSNMLISSKEAMYYHRYRENSAIAALKFNKEAICKYFKAHRLHIQRFILEAQITRFKVYFTQVLGALHALLNALLK